MVKQPDNYPYLDPEGANTVKEVMGKFLYYAYAVDPTMLINLNNIPRLTG